MIITTTRVGLFTAIAAAICLQRGAWAALETPHKPNAASEFFRQLHEGDAQSEAALSYVRHQKRVSEAGGAQPLTPTNILAEAKKTLAAFNLTGLSFAVVGPSGEIVACEGVGTYNADKTPVSCNDTLFQIASDTKQFTATLALKAEEDGLLSIDEDIRTFWPSFNPPTALSASRTLTLRDAMSHRSGMPRHDNLWQRGDLTGVKLPKDSLRVMQFLDPDKDIRYKSEYTNMMFLVAGEAVAHARNTTWENLLQKEILGPLGMHDTYPTLASVPKDALQRMSRPYYDKHAFKDLFSLDPVAPAGSIVSTAGDIAKWLSELVQVCDKKDDAQAVMGCEQFKKLATGNIPFGMYNPTYGMYGLGMWNEPYPAKSAPSGMAGLLHHGGNSIGFSSHIGLLPASKYGIVVLTNEQATSAGDALLLKIVDMILGQSIQDWDAVFGQVQAAQRLGRAQQLTNYFKQLTSQSVPPSFPDLKEYAGSYSHPAYGSMTFTVSSESSGRPSLRATSSSGISWNVHPANGNTFIVGDVPDFESDPTLMFTPSKIPQVVSFQFHVIGTSLRVFGLESSFDPEVGPIFFSKLMSPSKSGNPAFYLNQIVQEYPVGF